MRKARVLVAGWREWIRLPELSESPINAKLDTGARTSALHAFRIRNFERDGEPWVRFEIHPNQRSRKNVQVVEVRVYDQRIIRSSNGSEELRPVIKTKCQLDGKTWPIELTLTSRDAMSYRLLLGRTALRGRVVVDSGKSYLSGKRDSKK